MSEIGVGVHHPAAHNSGYGEWRRDPERFITDYRLAYLHEFIRTIVAWKRIRKRGIRYVGMSNSEIAGSVIGHLRRRFRDGIRRTFPHCSDGVVNSVMAGVESEARRYDFSQHHLERHLPWHRRNHDWSIPSGLLKAVETARAELGDCTECLLPKTRRSA